MECNESRSINWKTCFKKILAPHLLNPSEEQDNAPSLLNPCKDVPCTSNPINPEGQNDIVNTTSFLNNLEKLENKQNFNSSISVESAKSDDSSESNDFDLTNDKLSNSENPVETVENVESIIAAHAAELAKSFTTLKIKKKEKYFHNMAEDSRNAPDWNIAFKQVLDPKYVSKSSLKTGEKFEDKKPYLSYPELLDSSGSNLWTYHRLCKKDDQFENKEVPTQSSSENSNEERHYSQEEKKILEKLKQAKTLKRPEKPHMNIFDGAGVNCFTKNRSNTKKSKNVPPPGGWVCVKPVSIEEARNRPPNIISTECWDWDEDDL